MKYFAPLILSVLMVFPISASAATLTQVQVNAIISVLIAFGVDQATINAVSLALAPIAPETSVAPLYQPTQPVLDTTPPTINLKPMSSKWQESKLFINGLWGVLGLEEWKYVTDNSKIIGGALNVTVQWSVDGIPFESERKIETGSKKTIFDTTKYMNGEHTLTLRATDSAGNSSRASITITVKNPN